TALRYRLPRCPLGRSTVTISPSELSTAAILAARSTVLGEQPSASSSPRRLREIEIATHPAPTRASRSAPNSRSTRSAARTPRCRVRHLAWLLSLASFGIPALLAAAVTASLRACICAVGTSPAEPDAHSKSFENDRFFF